MKTTKRLYPSIWAAMLLCFVAMALAGCNAQKKNTAAARQYTAFITRYNIYYNGDKHFQETLEEMEKKYEDDYSRLVFMHPAEAKGVEKVPQPQGSFDRSIEKAQKAIQVRSIKKKPQRKSGRNTPEYKEWLKREEYNPFLHNAWMMMGRSQYYNGDFLGAASTFFYVSKHFTWLPQTVTEAKLWQAQSYLALDWLFEAETILNRIKPEQLDNSQLQNLYSFCRADLLVRSKSYAEALPYLQEAIAHAKGAQKTRLRFLLGQLYTQLGEKEKAYEAFKKAGSAASASYRTKFNARIKQSEVYAGANIMPEVKALQRMTRYDRNKEYLDQIYYAIGNLYLSRGDTLDAIKNYELAAEKSTRSGIDKAISQITLGGLYFDLGKYDKAQPCYSEALPQLPDTYPNYKQLKLRSDVLDELAVYAQNVALQDSLLHLASLSEEEQIKIIDKIISELKKKEEEEAKQAAREEFLANQQGKGNPLQDKNAREFNINTDNSWYFYNQASVSSGRTEFQRRWGARKLEDNWRRRNKSVFNTADFDASDEDEEAQEATELEDGENGAEQADAEAAQKASDPHNREYYLAQIPKTDEEKATAHEIIQEGLYNMGIILKDKLDDMPAALAQFDRLLRDYPDNVYRLDIYYNLYMMYMRHGEIAKAEHYRQLILQDFADSPYGQALKNPKFIENLRTMDQRVERLYEDTYQAYLDNENGKVHAAYARMEEEFPLSKTMPKFMFLEALTNVTENNSERFNQILRDMLDRYPDTDIAPIASAWLKGMAQGRELHEQADGGNLRGMLWDIRLGGDSIASSVEEMQFEINDEAPQLLVLVFSTDEVAPNQLLYEVARFNFNSFVVKDFDLELMNFGRLGILVVSGFENARELNHYRSVMAASATFQLSEGVTPVHISRQNFDMLLHQGRSFEDYFRFMEQSAMSVGDTEDTGAPDSSGALEESGAPDAPDATGAPEDINVPDTPEENNTSGAPDDTPDVADMPVED